MKSKSAFFAMTMLGFATQAQASQYGWCDVTGGNYEKYSSGIIEVEEGQEAFLAFRDGPFGQHFLAYVRAGHDVNAYNPDCHAKNRLSDVKDWMEMEEYANKNMKIIRTGWTGDRQAAVDGGEKSTRPEKGVIVAAPGMKVTPETTPANSRAASENRAKDDAEFARKQAEYEAALAENKRKHAEYERQEAERQAKLAEMRAKAAAEAEIWKARAAACKAGDHSQCGVPASRQ